MCSKDYSKIFLHVLTLNDSTKSRMFKNSFVIMKVMEDAGGYFNSCFLSDWAEKLHLLVTNPQ